MFLINTRFAVIGLDGKGVGDIMIFLVLIEKMERCSVNGGSAKRSPPFGACAKRNLFYKDPVGRVQRGALAARIYLEVGVRENSILRELKTYNQA